MLGSEAQQGLECPRRLLAPIMAKEDFIKISLELMAAHAVIGPEQPLGAACPYTSNWGLLKQPDKHELASPFIKQRLAEALMAQLGLAQTEA